MISLDCQVAPHLGAPNRGRVQRKLKMYFDVNNLDNNLYLCNTIMGENNDIAQMLALLHKLQGIDFIRQLRLITERHEFSPLDTDPQIFVVGGELAEDYTSLLNAARKAVELGNRVFMLPNPKGIRTADYIFERKGVYKMFDLKTIAGKNSVDNRLSESVGLWFDVGKDRYTAGIACGVPKGGLWFDVGKDRYTALR